MSKFILIGLFAMATFARAENFPAFEDLPSRPELPDPLTMLNGDKVTTKEQWLEKRKPELKALFQHYMYGYFPPAPEKIDVKVERENKNYFGGKATKKQITIRFGPAEVHPINILVIIPNAKKPAPVFLGVNFNGNHTVLNDPEIPLPDVWVPKRDYTDGNKATDAGRGKETDVWNIENTINRGYAVALYYCGDLNPDKNDLTDGVRAAYMKMSSANTQDIKNPRPHFWGTIAAWVYGMQRVVDYVVTDPDLDKTKIVAVGHSRLGKTAMLATAFDERIAIAIPLQAGCGGTAPSRGKVGEPVARINSVFPHWFCDEFKKFNEHTDKIPFDQHCLVALCAPRPVLFSNATEDTWANPAGQFEVLKAAVPVYKLLGAGGLDADAMPPENKLVDSTLGYFIRPGKHSMTLVDWNAFLDFADKHFGKK